jgi:hypothetical protein
VHVLQFFRELLFGVDVEVVEAFLPKMLSAVRQKPSCDRLLQSFHHDRRISSVRLGDHEMKLGHDYITQHVEAITPAYFIEYLYEDISRIRRSHEWLSLITTAGDVMVVVKTVDSDQIARHGRIIDETLWITHSSNTAMSGAPGQESNPKLLMDHLGKSSIRRFRKIGGLAEFLPSTAKFDFRKVILFGCLVCVAAEQNSQRWMVHRS